MELSPEQLRAIATPSFKLGRAVVWLGLLLEGLFFAAGRN